MEIERKFLITELPENLEQYPFHLIEQGYLCTAPVVRIRKQDEEYYLTYKSKGMMVREEYNLPLTAEAYYHLKEKVDGNLISKKRYLIPLTEKRKHSFRPHGWERTSPFPTYTITVILAVLSFKAPKEPPPCQNRRTPPTILRSPLPASAGSDQILLWRQTYRLLHP